MKTTSRFSFKPVDKSQQRLVHEWIAQQHISEWLAQYMFIKKQVLLLLVSLSRPGILSHITGCG
ncbi:hypothetical protein MJ258_01300 [Legionella sp. EUR-108]|uniref:Uncharacterized protein n=1 Tax=Legionella maioricensis TaxID=2896528 RepID=A0A9X2I8S8_9GAMM|nr:hypothetical protein [Legionella maioricensis]MCL9682610.1 hypothetical protein [Legionella maioricensis]MCL9686143.1 hypothetical protein [Legionella maioricensis]